MSGPRDTPGYPRRHPSRPDRDPPQSPDVYELLHEHDRRLGGLEGLAQENKIANATILSEVREIKATDRHATTKLIGAAISTIVLTVGGILGGQQLAKSTIPVTAPPPARSALDVRLDQCRPIRPGPSREECFARVTAETEH